MNQSPRPLIVLIPAATGDRGTWRKALPHDRRHHKAIRPEVWPPRREIPALDREALRQMVQRYRDATRNQAEAVLTAGRAMLAAA